MDMDKEAKYMIENISGVMSFVGPQGEPQALKQEEINRVLGVVEGSKGKEVVTSLFKVGDHVKVTDGPFLDFSGFVKEINDEKQKLKVSVSIFGRPTPVELDYLQVEKEK
jgi:transcriptional antiterminator NusG